MPAHMQTRSLTAIVTGIGLFVAIITAIAIPAGYFFVEYSSTATTLDFKAQLKANRVAKYAYSHDDLWQYQIARLTELIEIPEANDPYDQQRIFNALNKSLVEVGPQPDYPAMTRSAPIVVRGASTGRVEVLASAQPLLIKTAIVAGLSCLLGFGMFFAVRVLPLRALNRTLSALARSQLDLNDQNQRFDAALNNMSQGLVMFDANQQVVVCNDQYIKMYDLDRAVVKPGCTLTELFRHRFERGHLRRDPDQYRADLLAQQALGKPFYTIVETADGRDISISNQPMANGGWVATHEDITERRKAEAKISHMALHDALTDLPNRLYFHKQMTNRLEHLGRNETCAVHCLDLDRFKNVNDTLGHSYGDKLLRMVAERMTACLREGDSLARLGGDEFAVLQNSLQKPNDAIALAERVIKAVETPFDLDGQQVVIGVSSGIALAPADAADADRLLKSADMALYRAKSGRARHLSFFRARNGRAHAGAAHLGDRPTQGAEKQRVRSLLSAARQFDDPGNYRLRSPGALEPSGARHRRAARLHSIGRRNDADCAARRMGFTAGMCRSQKLAQPYHHRG